MTFHGLTGDPFWALFGGGALILLLLYILRFRRKGIPLSSMIIWHSVLGKRRAPWRRILSFLLQLLVLFLICAALTDPRRTFDAPEVRLTVLIVDASASMAVREDETSRMALAREIAREVIEDLGPLDACLLVRMDERATPLTTFTGDAARLLRALDRIEPSVGHEDIDAAIELARLSLGPRLSGAEAEVIVVSDRVHQLPPDGVPVSHVVVGNRTENIGIVSFDVRRSFALSPDYEVLVEVENFGLLAAAFELVIHMPEVVVGRIPMALDPGERVRKFYRARELTGGRLIATVANISGGDDPDAMAIDDQAFALFDPARRTRVLLVSWGNLFLEVALGLHPGVEFEEISPEEFRPEQGRLFDLVICDNVVPPPPWEGSFVFLNPLGEASPFRAAEVVEYPLLTGWDDSHPVLRDITLREINIPEATLFAEESGDETLVSNFGRPLVLARERGNQKLLGIGFDLNRSDLPLRVAFPCLVHNWIEWVSGGGPSAVRAIGPEAGGAYVGPSAAVPAHWGDGEVVVTGPDGSVGRAVCEGGRVALPGGWPGVYRIMRDGEPYEIALNFFDRAESSVVPERSGAAEHRARARPELPRASEFYWKYLLLAALALLLLDWGLFHRAKLY